MNARRHLLTGLLLGATLGACSSKGPASQGGGPLDVPGGGAGTRLAIEVLRGPDGLEQFHGFHDTVRDEDCSFRVASDGVWRCLPASPINRPGNEEVLFADADCSPASRLVRQVRVGPSVALVSDQASCPTRFQVHLLGTFHRYGAEYWHQSRPDGPCTSAGLAYEVTLAGLGEELPPTQFVAATERLGPAGSAVDSVVLVAEDGAWSQAGLRDVAAASPCNPYLALDGTWRCVPGAVASGLSGHRTDATCADPAVGTLVGRAGCAPTVAVTWEARECRGRSSFFGVGVALPGAFWANTSSGALVCTALDDYRRYWARGQAVDAASFPAGADVALGTGRLRAAAADFGGTPLLTHEFLDSQLGIRCWAGTFATEGVLRCVPTSEHMALVDGYADPACTERLAWADSCEAALANEAIEMADGTGWRHQFYRLGARFAGTVFTWHVPGGCLPATEPSPAGVPHRLGEFVPFNSFAPLSIEQRRR